MAGLFAVLNVAMYLSIEKHWIGGSSFLPMIGQTGPDGKFLFALVVNLGVVIGSFIGALASREFVFRPPRKEQIPRAVLGGILIGIGITLAPGTCTTAFVVGLPMLSTASVLSVIGIFLGSYICYSVTIGKRGSKEDSGGEMICP
jgi:hypothetical protein